MCTQVAMRQNKICASMICFLTICILIAASSQPVAFVSSRHRAMPPTLPWRHHRPTAVTAVANSEGNGANGDTSINNQKEILSKVMARSQMMHAMLRVPNVNATIDYWKSRGATVQSYRKSPKATTAFVGFGDSASDKGFFSLEITTLASGTSLQLGNGVSYFGLSMLLDFDLEKAAAGEKPTAPSTAIDPNGIQVRSVAAAPGDSFSRFCLRTASSVVLAKTVEFYMQLGMEIAAGDETCACLRYTATQKDDSEIQRAGVATTLYFEKPNADDTADLDLGNCFDHFAISTLNVDVATEALRAILVDNGDDEDAISKIIFMEPTVMFGNKIVGLYDPNGYKVYLVEELK